MKALLVYDAITKHIPPTRYKSFRMISVRKNLIENR